MEALRGPVPAPRRECRLPALGGHPHPGDWVWLRINDEDRAWEVIQRADTEFGTVEITLDDDSTWHLPRNLPVEHTGEDIVLNSDGEPIGLRLDADFVLDDDVIEFDLAPDGAPLAPTGGAGTAASNTMRIRGRARVTHRHPHGGGERTYLLDATIVNGAHIQAAPELLAIAFELPEHVYRLSLRAPLSEQEAQPQPTALAPSTPQPVFTPFPAPDAEFEVATELELTPELKAELEADPDLELDIEGELEADLAVGSELEGDTELDYDPEPETEDAPDLKADAELDSASEADPEPDREQDSGPQEEAGPQTVTALPTRRPEGEELRLSLLRLINDPGAPSTPTEHTAIDDTPLFVRVVDSREHGRVMQFGFDPEGPASGQFTVATLEGATGANLLQALLDHRKQKPAESVRDDLLRLLDTPTAPSEPTRYGEIGSLDLYVAVSTHPEHGRVLRFGFTPDSPVGTFTRSVLDGGTNTKVRSAIERYGSAFVQGRIDEARARDVRDRFRAAAEARQATGSPVPHGGEHQPRPEAPGQQPTPFVSQRR